MPIDERMIVWDKPADAAPKIDPRMVVWNKPAPSSGGVLANALNKGIAGVPDAILNTPTNAANLGIAAYGALATALGRPDLAPELMKNPDLAHTFMKSMGLIRDDQEPQTRMQRVLDMGGQAAGGALLSPASGLKQAAANIALGGGSGLVGGAVGEATGSPLMGAAASMGALPVAAAAANTAVRGGRLIAGGQEARTGRILATAADMSPAELAEQIKTRNIALVPGSAPTTTQAAMNPGISQLQRSAQAAGADFSTRNAQQNDARLAHLDTIAPGAGNFTSHDAGQNAGNVVSSQAGELRQLLKEARGGAYNSPALEGATLNFPDPKAARAAIEKFYPGAAYGTDGHGLARFVDLLESGAPVPIKEFDALRKMAGNKQADLRESDRTASAAFGTVKSLFDDAEAAAIARHPGGGQPAAAGNTFPAVQRAAPANVEEALRQMLGDASTARAPAPPQSRTGGMLSPDQAEMLGQGRFLHKTMIDRYGTGPAAGLWRTGADGLPVKQGAEVASAFYNSGASQTNDIAQLWKMLPGNQDTAIAMRQYAMADLLEKSVVPASGLLSDGKLTGYANTRSGAIKGLLSSDQMDRLDAVRADLRRATAADNLNRVSGSDTAQKLLGAGMLENPWVTRGASMLPKIGPAAVDWLKNVVRQQQAQAVSKALLDPGVAGRSLLSYEGLLAPTPFDGAGGRVAPYMGMGLLGTLP